MNSMSRAFRLPALIILAAFLGSLGCSGSFLGKKEVIVTKPQAEPSRAETRISPGPKAEAPAPSSAERDLFNRAETAWYQEKYPEALEQYEAFVRTYPGSALAVQARFSIGLILEKLNRVGPAREAYQSFLKEYPGSGFNNEVRLRLAALLVKAGQYDQAQAVLKPLSGTSDPDERYRLNVLIGQTLAGQKEYAQALERFVQAHNLTEDGNDRLEARVQTLSIILNIPLARLAEIKTAYKDEFPGGYILYCLAYRYFRAGYKTEARSELGHFFESFYGHELTDQARELEKAIEGSGPVPSLYFPGISPSAVSLWGPDILDQDDSTSGEAGDLACLLPLTGNASKYGQKVLKGIQMAFKLYEPQTENFRPNLIILDSEGEPDQTVLAVDRLASRSGVLAVIGPITTKVASEAAERAEGQSLPMISLSQKEGIPQIGRHIFRLFLTPEAQAKAMADYAVQILGLTRLAILAPDDDYGKKMRDAFWDEVNRLGVEVVGFETYRPDTTDFSEQIQKLAGIEKAERLVEADYAAEVNFQAVFLPDNYKAVAMIAPQFAYHDITSVRLLGTNLWHTPRLLETAARYTQKSIFPASFYPDMDKPHIKRFVEAFRGENEGQDPDKFEAYGFDAATLLLTLMDRDKISSREGLVRALFKLVSFPGVTSGISFTLDGELKTDPVLLTVIGDEFKLIQ